MIYRATRDDESLMGFCSLNDSFDHEDCSLGPLQTEKKVREFNNMHIAKEEGRILHFLFRLILLPISFRIGLPMKFVL